MRIDRICYEQLYPTGVYANQRYRVEVLIEEGDYGVVSGHELLTREEAAQRAFKYAKQIVEDTFVALNPQITWDDRGISPTENSLGVINKEKERVEIAIDNCASKAELQLLQNDALKYKLEKEYLDKLKSFQ